MSLAISITLISEVIVGALSFTGISYDGHTLEAVLQKKQTNLIGKVAAEMTLDCDYRDKSMVVITKINILQPFSEKRVRKYQQNKLKISSNLGHQYCLKLDT